MDEQALGNYQLLYRIGYSAIGDLYRVMPPDGNEPLLLQLLPVKLPAAQVWQDLRWNAGAMAGPGRVSIASIQDVGNDEDGNLYLVFSIAGTQPVEQLFVAATGPLPTGKALALASQIALLLDQSLEQGLSHHLLLPHNILLDETQSPILLGLDLPTSLVEKTLPLLTEEELCYLSPEQRQGNSIDARSNIYSIGVILHTLLAGFPPGEQTEQGSVYAPLRERRPDIPEAVLRLVAACLQPNGWMRFQSFAALQTAIAEAMRAELAGEPTSASAPIPIRAGARTNRRRPSLRFLLAVGALFVVAIAALASGFWLLVQRGALAELANSDIDIPVAEEPATSPPPTQSAVPAGQEWLLSSSATPLPGRTPTVVSTRTPFTNTGTGNTGAPVPGGPTATSVPRATATQVGSDMLRGNILTPPPSPTRIFFLQPTPTATNQPPEPPPADEQPSPPPPPPPAPPPPTEAPPTPTATPDEQPPPTATPPLPGGN